MSIYDRFEKEMTLWVYSLEYVPPYYPNIRRIFSDTNM
jgi:hypothetical protein